MKRQLAQLLPFWRELNPRQQELLETSASATHYAKNTVVHGGNYECTGLLLVKEGQLRAYIISENGREVTLYHLLDGDICLFSASCAMRNIQFDITVSAAAESEVILIPPNVYQKLMEESLPVANFTNQLMASRFTEVMWLIEQVMFKRFDTRLAAFLLSQSSLLEAEVLMITHDEIARHLGSAREVVTRMLKHFQEEGLVSLFRGGIRIEQTDGLLKIAEEEAA